MKVYCVTKNSGPTWGTDPYSIVYIGTSLQTAIDKIGSFSRYEEPNEKRDGVDWRTIIPSTNKPKLIKFYMADGWWMSLVEFELHPTSALENTLAEKELGLPNKFSGFETSTGIPTGDFRESD